MYGIVVRQPHTLFTKWSPYFKYPSGMLCSTILNITDYVPYTVLYTPWLLCNCQFVLLNPFTFSPSPPNPSPLAIISLFFIYESLFILFVHLFCSLDFTCKRNHMNTIFYHVQCVFFAQIFEGKIKMCIIHGSTNSVNYINVFNPVIYAYVLKV